MRRSTVCSLLALFLYCSLSYAGEVREIEMTDGSIIAGEVVSLTNGVYSIRSEALGLVKIQETKVRSIRTKAAGTTNPPNETGATAAQTKRIQDTMMNDPEVMKLILSLQADPEFAKALDDPALLQAVNSGDIAALMANPRFMKLLGNPGVQDIQTKIK